jgi:hypothetical protein
MRSPKETLLNTITGRMLLQNFMADDKPIPFEISIAGPSVSPIHNTSNKRERNKNNNNIYEESLTKAGCITDNHGIFSVHPNFMKIDDNCINGSSF